MSIRVVGLAIIFATVVACGGGRGNPDSGVAPDAGAQCIAPWQDPAPEASAPPDNVAPRRLWRAAFKNIGEGTPVAAVADDLVAIGYGNIVQVYSLTGASTGTLALEAPVVAIVGSRDGKKFLVVSDRLGLYAVESATWDWRSEPMQGPLGRPLLDSVGNTYVCDGQNATSLNAQGQPRWRVPLAEGCSWLALGVSNAIVVHSSNHEASVLRSDNGGSMFRLSGISVVHGALALHLFGESRDANGNYQPRIWNGCGQSYPLGLDEPATQFLLLAAPGPRWLSLSHEPSTNMARVKVFDVDGSVEREGLEPCGPYVLTASNAYLCVRQENDGSAELMSVSLGTLSKEWGVALEPIVAVAAPIATARGHLVVYGEDAAGAGFLEVYEARASQAPLAGGWSQLPYDQEGSGWLH